MYLAVLEQCANFGHLGFVKVFQAEPAVDTCCYGSANLL